jgi:2-methylcitrate dehydratase PrpD
MPAEKLHKPAEWEKADIDGELRVVDFIVNTEWENLPLPVQRKVRMCLLDTLGATLVGTRTEASKIMARYAGDLWRANEATILLHGKRAAAPGAALANGYSANGVDIDDCGIYTRGHPGAQIFSTALAVAEKLELSGAQLLTSMAVGYEVALRSARCWHDDHHTYQACGSWGSIACAAVSGNLMHLTRDQARNALGIAEYHAPYLPMMRDIDSPSMVKHGIGWGAMNGIISADLAARGFTGIPSILSFEKYHSWVSDIGKRYLMVDGIAWKEHAGCAWSHAALNGARNLVQSHSISTDEIVHIHVESFHEAVRLGGDLPSNTEEAQFNLSWLLAAILIHGEVYPEQVLEPALSDRGVRDLASKVELVESDELNDLSGRYAIGDPQGRLASKVSISLRDGRVLNSGMVESGICYPQPGWDEERLEHKVRRLIGGVLTETAVDQIIDLVWHLDEITNVRSLTDLLA